MIYIVSGEINSGKTSWMATDFGQQKNADGFICRKVFVGDTHIGYNLEHLSTGERCHFIRKPEFLPENWREVACLAKKYSFCEEGFCFAQKIADSALAKNCQRFYLDEIGPLELMKKGFYSLLKQLLQNRSLDLVIAVRASLVTTVIDFFELQEINYINIV
ncbi:MAG: nucleoside-triphosphatase [Candidatus Riflebacteria bacterium]|nr:nucleoside-triphosphatase [Candidatus Riflebacteria bacterium]